LTPLLRGRRNHWDHFIAVAAFHTDDLHARAVHNRQHFYRLYMLVDYMLWQKNVIRSVTVDAQGITLRRGKDLVSTRILKGQVN